MFENDHEKMIETAKIMGHSLSRQILTYSKFSKNLHSESIN